MTTMFERQQAIVRLLGEQPGVRVPELADLLDVSVGTIRNDLNALQDESKLRRVRGGAVLVSAENPLNTIPNQPAKQRLAQRAIEMVASGDAIWLDAGTTVQMMVPLLVQRRDLTIVTNGLRVALQLAEQTDHRVLLIGGRISKEGLYTIGMGNDPLLGTVNIHTAFISGVGLTLESGLTVSEYEDAQLKQRVIASAENVVALIDSSKIGRRGFAPVAQLDQLSHLLTDKDVSAEMLRQLRRARVNVTICGAKTTRSHTVSTSHYRIGFANQSEESPFAVDVRRGLEQAVAARDDIDLVISDNKLSSVEALRVANELIERDVDLVIEYQIDAHTGNLLMDKFQRANIPVIAVDIPMIGATFFGVDNYRGGVMAGEVLGDWVLAQWGGQFDHLVILEEPRAGDLPKARLQGQQDAFGEKVGVVSADKITHLNSGNTVAISQQAMRDFLQTIPATDRCAVISFNDEAAVGAIRAAREMGRERQLAVVGQGGDRLGREELRRLDSPLIGTTAYMPEKYGGKLIEIALDILQGKSVPPAIYMAHRLLTQENIGRNK